MRKYGVSSSKQIKMAVPRIILAILIGITIARPLELKIFEKEVNVKVQDNMHNKILQNDSLLLVRYQQDLQNSEAEKNILNLRKTALEDTLHRMQMAYIQEADGTGGSGRRGIESLTRLKMKSYEDKLKTLTPEIESLNAGINYHDSLIRNFRSGIAAESENYKNELQASVGFLEKNKALTDLQDEESSVFWASLLISLLIIIIETGPVFAKLIMPKGPYDIALGSEELLNMAKEEEKIRMKKKVEFERREKFRIMDEERVNGFTGKLTEMQQRIFAEELEKWEKGEKSGITGREDLNSFLNDFKKKYKFGDEHVF